jgi:hypothetical protein
MTTTPETSEEESELIDIAEARLSSLRHDDDGLRNASSHVMAQNGRPSKARTSCSQINAFE